MAAKLKPVASGIDLTGLTAAQLDALVYEARAKSMEQSDKERKASVKALKASGELDAFKKEFLALGKEGKKLTCKATFELVLPIKFTVTTDGPRLSEDGNFTSLFNYDGEITEGDLFDHSFTAKLLKDNNLTKKQAAALNAVVADYAENACNAIYEVVPDEFITRYDEFAAKVDAFVRKAKSVGLSLEDLV